jgi:transcription antitermination factor NusG
MSTRRQKIERIKQRATDVMYASILVGGVLVAAKVAVDVHDTKKKVKTVERDFTDYVRVNDADFRYLEDQIGQAHEAFVNVRKLAIQMRDVLENNGMPVKV